MKTKYDSKVLVLLILKNGWVHRAVREDTTQLAQGPKHVTALTASAVMSGHRDDATAAGWT
jgi:hypothetical protein